MTSSAETPARLRSLAQGYTAAWCSQDAARVACADLEPRAMAVACDIVLARG
jgi:hypothetical protein